jgi:hypothetical protein
VYVVQKQMLEYLRTHAGFFKESQDKQKTPYQNGT